MTKIDYNVILRNNVEYVFDKLYAKSEFEEWTSSFAEGSHYVGNIAPGEIVYFYDKDLNGMKSKVSKYEINKVIEFSYLADVIDGVEKEYEDTNNFERYTFTQLQEGFVRLEIELGMPEEYVPMMEAMWPKAIDNIFDMFDNEE